MEVEFMEKWVCVQTRDYNMPCSDDSVKGDREKWVWRVRLQARLQVCPGLKGLKNLDPFYIGIEKQLMIWEHVKGDWYNFYFILNLNFIFSYVFKIISN